MVLQPLRPALLLMTCVLATSARRERAEYCELGQKRYTMGQTWHPHLPPFGENTCINCTCYEGGEVKCKSIDCPRPDCEEPKIKEGECCPSCDVGMEGSKEEEDQKPGCHFDDVTFKDGELFPSNNTGLRPTRQEQCVMCVCSMGKVFCHLKTCLPTKCKKFKRVPDDCCPQCADESVYSDVYLHYVLSDPKQDNRSEADCTTAMGLHQNGSSWHPVIGNYGEVDCIVCTCLNGFVACDRVECPAEDSLPCKRPRIQHGSCCKQCGGGGGGSQQRKDKLKDQRGKGPGGSGAKKKRGRKRGKGRKIGKKRRKQKGASAPGYRTCKKSDQSAVHPHRKANVTSVANIVTELCLPRNTDRLVYKDTGDNFRMLAIDHVTGKFVAVLRWDIKKGKLQDIERRQVDVREFRSAATCNQIIRATNNRGFRKLLKKIESKLKKCKAKGKPCSVRTLDRIIARDRRLKAIPTKGVCGE